MRFRLVPRLMTFDDLELSGNFAGCRCFGRQRQPNEWR